MPEDVRRCFLTCVLVAALIGAAAAPPAADAHELSVFRARLAAKKFAASVVRNMADVTYHGVGRCSRRDEHHYLCRVQYSSAEGTRCSALAMASYRSHASEFARARYIRRSTECHRPVRP